MKRKSVIVFIFALFATVLALTGCSKSGLPSDLAIKAEDVFGVPSGEYYIPYEIEKYNDYANEYGLSVSVNVYDLPSNDAVTVTENRAMIVEKEHTYAVVVRVDGNNGSKQKTFQIEAEKGNRVVTFMHSANEVVKIVTLPYGGSMDFSEVPELEDRYPSSTEGHYTELIGKNWVVYKETNVATVLTAEDLTDVTENIPVYSDYKYVVHPLDFTMKFDSDGGTEIPDYNGNADVVAPMPIEKPIKEGYTFVGWCDDEARKNLHNWKSAEKMTKNVTLYAKWVKNTVSPTPDGYFNYTLKEDDCGNEYYEISARDKNILTGKLVLPNNYNGLPVRDMAEKAFMGTKITEVVIPATYMLQKQRAFSDCKQLTDVYFEENSVAENLASEFFWQCVALKNINLPSGIRIIRPKAFLNCLALTKITLPSSLQTINNNVFYGCKSLTEIKLPDSVINIDEKAFADCSNLFSVTVSENSRLSFIGSNIFADTAVTEITLPYALKAKKPFEGTTIKVNYYPEQKAETDQTE